MTFFAFWNSEADPKAGSSVICMYLLVGWAICIAVDQFLSSRVILCCSKLRSTRWGLESYSSHPLGIQEQSGWVHRWVSSHSYIYGRLLGSFFFQFLWKTVLSISGMAKYTIRGQNHMPRFLQVLLNSQLQVAMEWRHMYSWALNRTTQFSICILE